MIFTSAFKKAVKRLEPQWQSRAQEAMAEIVRNPVNARGDTIQRLSHDKAGLWRYRFGDYRIVYLPRTSAREVVFVRLATREDVYH
jgi:mRNA-degrading endonuclease RelE of RelBE toxin-antitoxin system